MSFLEKENFDVIVIGGGHAGIESSLISSRLGKKVALITLDKKKIGIMHCNPSIGGPAKGIVVREIDALGGEMGKAADATALQFKLLNTSGGLAIQALRVQSDKIAYSNYMKKIIRNQNNLNVIEESVEKLIIKNNKVEGVILSNKKKIYSKVVIITTGTYLSPIIYKGKIKKEEGPDGEKRINNGISNQLKKLGFGNFRLKTGTSPRVIIDKEKLESNLKSSNLELQLGTNLPLRFSLKSKLNKLRKFENQEPCYLLYTNEKIHKLIRENSHLSPIFFEKKLGAGPRNCPSIEHKVCNFIERERHQIFLEPESKKLETSYIQGLSTSLPIEIQKEILKNIPVLENSKIEKWGYAIEYDVIDSNNLKISLETKIVENLFIAGQINGTTGYEEAAAQGLIAGINASRKIENKEPLILEENESYIAVLIRTLVTEKINDPYRLLTSRAKYRLLLRHDNSHTRLLPISYKLGILKEKDWIKFKKRETIKEKIKKELKSIEFNVNKDLINIFPNLRNIENWKTIKKINGEDLLKKIEISIKDFEKLLPEIKKLNWEEGREIETTIKYQGYIKRQEKEIEELKNAKGNKIPDDINYEKVNNLSKEAIDKLGKIRPISIEQAMKINGVNDVDLQFLNYYLKKNYNERK